MLSGLDAAGFGLLTEGLRSAGMSDDDVEAVAGGAALHLLRVTLPSENDPGADVAAKAAMADVAAD